VTSPAKRPATYADIEALPPHVTGEIIDGVLYTQPRPSNDHGLSATSLSDEIVGPYQKGRGGPGGWWFIGEPELHLGPHTLSPDICGWRRERMPKVPRTKFVDNIVPNWVCELLSDSTEKRDRGEKRLLYATYGVDHYWIVDPRVRSVEVFQRLDRQWLALGYFTDAEKFSAPPFEAITIDLSFVWSDVDDTNREADPPT
jgi:Uma2 family endonuclease